jgi:hypothetical protein
VYGEQGWTSGLFLPAANVPVVNFDLTMVALLIAVGILHGLVWMLFNSGV